MILTMSESVSTEDSHDSVPRTNSTRGQFESLKNLKREMEFRNSELGKTWSELSRIMYQYQSELIQKHDELDSSLAPGERARISHLESVIDNSKTNVSKLEKRISELEYKLLEKDSEIVRLRTEVHQLKNEVTMKDNLIQKLQNQMANEAMEYQNEIVSLKELLQVESITNLVAESRESAPLGAKRRKAAQTGRTSPHYTTEESSYTVKAEQASHNPPVFPSPQPVSSNGQPMDEEEAENLHASTSENREAEFPESSSPEENSADLELEGDGQGENRLLMDDVYGATGQQSQAFPTKLYSSDLRLPNALLDNLQPAFHDAHWGGRPRNSYDERCCKYCGKFFANKSNKDDHVRGVHLHTKPFKCTLCGKKSAQKGGLYGHLKGVHQIVENRSAYIEKDPT